MRKIFSQPYTGNRSIDCWYGKPPKGIAKCDVIKLHLPFEKYAKGNYFWISPDEASTIIRALSAGLSHYLVKEAKK